MANVDQILTSLDNQFCIMLDDNNQDATVEIFIIV